MSADDKFMAAFFAVIIALLAAAVFWLIDASFDNEERNDRLQERCIELGGNWDYGCDMKPVSE